MIADDIVILVYKRDKNPTVVNPFNISHVNNFWLAENVPSAGALAVDRETEKDT